MKTHNRHVWICMLTTPSIGLGLTLALLWLLGWACIPAAQASPPTCPSFAPLPAHTNPTYNALNVPINSNVSVTFDEPINPTSVTSRTFAVYGSQSPIFTGIYSLSNLSRTVTLDPDRSFFPGERVDATITTATLNITGEQAISSTVWQFWAAVSSGTGHFCHSGHDIGPGNDDTESLALGDVDGDGDLDLAVGNWYQPNAVYLNDGDATFDTISSTVGSSNDKTQSLALGDVDGDGDLDLAVGNQHQPNVIYLNDGDGTFDTISSTIGPGNDATYSLALGDVDGDGDLDLATGNGGISGEQNVVYLNDGDGTFDTISSTVGPGNDATYSLALGDVDGDGDLDLAVGNWKQPNVVYLNDGDGTFDTISSTVGPGNDATYGLALGDVDGDGDLDLAVGNIRQQNAVYLNNGSGAFEAQSSSLGTGDNETRSLALGDLDGDGDLDLAVGNIKQNTVYLNPNHLLYLALVLRNS